MKAVFKKLKSKAGESLVETLAAILIFAMASIVMYSMVTTAADINMTAKDMDKKNQAHLIAVETGADSAKTGTGTVSFKIGNELIAQTSVDIYGGNEGSLYAFYVGG